MSRLLLYRCKVSNLELNPNKWRDYFIRKNSAGIAVKYKRKIIQPKDYHMGIRFCFNLDHSVVTNMTELTENIWNAGNAAVITETDRSRETEIANEMSRNINFDWSKFMSDDLPFYLRRILEIGYLDLFYKYRRHVYGELIIGLESPINRAALYYLVNNIPCFKANFPLPVYLLYPICKKYSTDDNTATRLVNWLAKKL